MPESHKFTPADLLMNDAVRTVDVPGVGVVSYIPLTTREALEISNEKLGSQLMNAKEAWLMIKKANPDLMPFEDFIGDRTDGRAVVEIITALLKERSFRV
jgi:hypothetical protein